MGADVADLDNDGDDELMVVDMLSDSHERQMTNATAMRYNRFSALVRYGYDEQIMRNVLQVNNGDGTYSDLACIAGLYKTDWSWGPLFVDADNDGLQDIYITNGFRREVSNMDFTNYTLDSIFAGGATAERITQALNMMPSHKVSNYFYANRGDYQFDNVARSAGLGEPTFSNGAAYADLNKDGLMDLIVHNFDDPLHIYANRSKSGRHLAVELTGRVPNLEATGSTVTVFTDRGNYRRTKQPTRGFFSSQSTRLLFGLGQSNRIDSIVVVWPDGSSEKIVEGLGANPIHLTQGQLGGGRAPGSVAGYARVKDLPLRHRENVFSHFLEDPLLYRTLDAEGPVAAVADLNGDGFDDAYLGASTGARGSLMFSTASGSMRFDSSAFNDDLVYEDGSAAFFDADGDGDLDLYVGSTGVVSARVAGALQDRLYVNDGRGQFTRDLQALPAMNYHSSAVGVIDLDKDGRQDLVVAHHANASNFPEQEPNQVLLNLGGRFELADANILPGWQTAGMIQDIEVADIDGKGQPEVIAAGEWTDVLVWQSNGASFSQVSSTLGLADRTGLWFSVTTGDLDQDGDLDIVLGGLGLNTRFTTALGEPLRLPSLDYDNNGKLDPLVFGTKSEDEYWPYVRREELTKQVPAFAKTYTRYAPYARATMSEIIGSRSPTHTFTAENLASQVCWQDAGRFSCEDLPRDAQHSVIQDAVISPLDDGEQPDFFAVGNLYGMEIHGGPLDAGQGVFLTGDSSVLTHRPNTTTGLWAKGDARTVKLLRTATGNQLLLGRNNQSWQLLSLN